MKALNALNNALQQPRADRRLRRARHGYGAKAEIEREAEWHRVFRRTHGF
ncbi:hypothetical protein [Salipiger mangrovisoli]|uniref:DUF3563 domain-containing protein n=1 Tax=Salipiger mangrovisoli TaxID=2865933 RepID=A0ABR9X1R4_9RHOB|nr:hypothetical protein [Salipiger mangrovisoli]MBE9637478.1 hypothetical protein [Salipiger mangrovisoli]